MSDVFFHDLGLREPDWHLDVGSGSHAEQTAKVMLAFEPLLDRLAPEITVVVGDVNSTVACALVGAKSPTLVAHVEAGLRSRDWSMPEEINRIVTDHISDFLFAPSPDGVENLLAEGIDPDRVHLVGNVMVDTLLANLERARRRPILEDLGLVAGGYGLVTLHRPSNVDDRDTFDRLMDAVERIALDLPLVFPAHPRSAASLADRARQERVSVIEPLSYLDFLALESQARLVLTDSGGVQEETTMLGVPCLTLRENTERPITVTEGTNVVVGTAPERIIAAARTAIQGGVEQRVPSLWDGKAAERIADALTAGRPD
jgi:UDP-N-acetylglucosamine 2-epimerase (non-hydrolysing)